MTGSGLAPLIIPIAGTLFLTAWLTLVFYAGRRTRGGRRQSGARPRKSGPGRAGCLAPARRPSGGSGRPGKHPPFQATAESRRSP